MLPVAYTQVLVSPVSSFSLSKIMQTWTSQDYKPLSNIKDSLYRPCTYVHAHSLLLSEVYTHLLSWTTLSGSDFQIPSKLL